MPTDGVIIIHTHMLIKKQHYVGGVSEMQDPQKLHTKGVEAFQDKLFEALMEANQLLYDSFSEENTKLYLASCILRRMMDYYIAERVVDCFAVAIKIFYQARILLLSRIM